MAGNPTKGCVPALSCLFFSLLLVSPTMAAIKAVNLGGWLVTEGWIKPSLFDGIDNNDLLDGRRVRFKSVTLNMYVCAEGGGGQNVVANRPNADNWETFKLWRVDSTHFQFRVFQNQFVGLDTLEGPDVVANRVTALSWETFEIVRRDGDPNRVRIKANNGRCLQVDSAMQVKASSSCDGSWDNDDPSVFLMEYVGDGMRGEYQVTNGYGPDRAPAVMREHWRTFIVEKDFRFMKEKGLDAVRWWIASGPNPPAPFVGGSLEALDNAFTWARTYGLKVIVDLHAAPGSQNGDDHVQRVQGRQPSVGIHRREHPANGGRHRLPCTEVCQTPQPGRHKAAQRAAGGGGHLRDSAEVLPGRVRRGTQVHPRRLRHHVGAAVGRRAGVHQLRGPPPADRPRRPLLQPVRGLVQRQDRAGEHRHHLQKSEGGLERHHQPQRTPHLRWGMGGRVGGAGGDDGGLPEVRQGADGGVRSGQLRVGVLDLQTRLGGPLEPRMDDQQWLHLPPVGTGTEL